MGTMNQYDSELRQASEESDIELLRRFSERKQLVAEI